MGAIDPGDRVRVISGGFQEGAEGVVRAIYDGTADIVPDGAKSSTISVDVDDLELIAKGNGEAPAAPYAVGWGT